MFDAYKKIAGCEIEESIKDEFTGNVEKVLLAVGERALRAINQHIQAHTHTHTNVKQFY